MLVSYNIFTDNFPNCSLKTNWYEWTYIFYYVIGIFMDGENYEWFRPGEVYLYGNKGGQTAVNRLKA